MRARPTLVRPLGPALDRALGHTAALLLCVGVAASSSLAQPASPDTRSKIDIPKVQDDGKGRPPIFADLSFADALAKAKSENKLLIIKFTAEWCGPCKQIAPTIDALADEYKGKLTVGKVDVDREQVIAQQLRVTSIPALFLFKGGKVVWSFAGAAPRSKIEAEIKKHV